MADIVTPQVRSRLMAGIRGKDTKPELLIRKGLHQLGFRYRLHTRKLPGKPDLLFPKYRAVIFVHGCFWHRHRCNLFKWPATRKKFWRNKIESNRKRDIRVRKELARKGWRILVVWECALKGTARLPEEVVIRQCVSWLTKSVSSGEIAGRRRAG